jgi:hypothetical protein
MLKNLTPTAAELIRNWDAKAKAAKAAVAEERDARAAVVAHVFDGADYGTNNFDLGNGYTLKYVRSINYTLDTKDVDPNTGASNTDRALDNIRALGNDGQFIADRLVKWKPELSVSEYKLLPNTHKKIIDTVITTKDASPSIEITGPK